MSDDRPTCFAKTCERDATVILAYVEPGTPHTEKPACREHENMERIHDPVNVRVARRLDGGTP